MKTFLKFIISIAMLIGFTSCSEETNNASVDKPLKKLLEQKYYYTCSMHPQIHEDKPGKCPICHMNLTKVLLDEDDSHLNMSDSIKKSMDSSDNIVGKVKLRKAQMKHFKPDLFPVQFMKMTKKIRLLGSVLPSEEAKSSIPARVSGRVEKVHVDSTGSIINKGDAVVDIYSPELITAGEEYILARQSYEKSHSKVFKEMMNQSAEKLNLWGIKNYQYESWFRKGKVPRNITIHSNTKGVVIKLNAAVGKYFKEGQNFFELWDLSNVWIEMDVYESDASLVKLGQKIELQFSSIPGKILVSSINFINPFLDKKSRTLKVRTTIKNIDAQYKPGMVANAVLNVDIDGMPLIVPRTAIIDTGKRKVVWVKIDNNNFQAKEIDTGYESDGYVEITKGLTEGEEIVIEGNFLLDAQAQLFGGYEDMKENKVKKHHH